MSALEVGARVVVRPGAGELAGEHGAVVDVEAGGGRIVCLDDDPTRPLWFGPTELAAEAASAGPIDEVPGVERDPGYVSSVRPSSSTAGLAALRHRGVRRDR